MELLPNWWPWLLIVLMPFVWCFGLGLLLRLLRLKHAASVRPQMYGLSPIASPKPRHHSPTGQSRGIRRPVRIVTR